MKQPSEMTVLVVDDEKLLCTAIANDFKRKGYKILCANNGHDAFELVKTQSVDLIISDVRMPGGDGIELLNNVKNFNYELPVVMFITGFADMTLEQAYNMGADAVFAKPFNRKALMDAAGNALTPKDQKWVSRNERVEVDMKIELQLSDMTSAIEGKVINLGRGGIFVTFEGAPPRVDTSVRFKITFEKNDPLLIEGDGIVRWSRTKDKLSQSAACGIEFVTLNSEGSKSVMNLVKTQKTKAFIPSV
jgi:CheY-like chemotaxis protein